ncbi:dGTPase [Corynebacterium glutamicum MB001]|uniref:Deoxyguanosinetriphosphate triphosphohydrolase-like protein n=1 Tax=Corynebacterium glutamicum (strain ATCC 13032 / DSM 20300 / JCM 1318 / BCRC 11384 / CCUG 27702 / LMG 3730 / NBRC 12168 / NCIMB 10025 / NRRL B-2784 / 534) TaxID=196627 RepID=DGTL1_CORGL|nr:deoxyguanosinetriphosphate triphosphohydrolase [Corynebacterium glutamicum]Q8NND1.1 RecName: Full=Deoxyguanosinetriphosphate triphosphohydrolase-like protein [Corynebacterium glutamicum ATCC 13032]AGT06002.1 dGTPase [Corynebacterium glutamicum MB001]ARV63693.1 deoxyguanosinetriphosphate triphosphohydrolase [Corynebacterium glutamicum]ASW14642.1 dGTPase [Corynebacterium glutamicum]AUI01712.1 deoxyguanosinetriphosphate triphosphohydrolase [Corynebacterium glutamicum]AUI05384.1 deoxyguanosine
MYPYSDADAFRRQPERAKSSQLRTSAVDTRSAFARDRARVLHSAALRRLADKTQVVGPNDGDTPRTRLTHSLEVAQIARGIGAGLDLDPDLCDLAGLCHDIGHPPYGHNGENALNEVAAACGGFEGNAQTLRILTRLEPKIVSDEGESFGLNLSRAALDAACKYPWAKTNADGSVNKKYSAYDEDAEILAWIRQGHEDLRPPIEAQVMDFSDDIAYSVHDVEDGIVSGRIDLKVLWDLVELAALADKGAAAFGGSPAELIEGAASLRELPVVAAAADFDFSLRSYAALKAMTSELVGRYVGSTIESTKKTHAGIDVGRMHGDLIIPETAASEVKLLKTLAVLYVMDDPGHLARQNRQRDRIFRVFDYLVLGAPGSLDPMYRQWFIEADSESEQIRVIVDQIASMTESRLERLARNAADISGFLG